VPALQLVALSLPTGQKVPSPHVMQSSTLLITSRLRSLRVPLGHGSGVLVPSAQ
jgi:hypothetical protein